MVVERQRKDREMEKTMQNLKRTAFVLVFIVSAMLLIAFIYEPFEYVHVSAVLTDGQLIYCTAISWHNQLIIDRDGRGIPFSQIDEMYLIGRK